MKIEPLSQRAARLVRRLAEPRARGKEGLVLVEGTRAAATVLEAGARVRMALVSPRLLERPEGVGLVERLTALGADVRPIDDRELSTVSDTETPQGVLLVCEEPRSTLGALPVGRWLVLDAVQDPGNAGTLVRAAVAFGVGGVVALDGTVDLWGAKAVRASVGLVYSVPVVRVPTDELVGACRDRGMTLFVADARGEDVAGVPAKGPWALVMGNEGAGVRPDLDRAGRRVAVAMRGPAESLNVGVAGSILLYVLTRENGFG